MFQIKVVNTNKDFMSRISILYDKLPVEKN